MFRIYSRLGMGNVAVEALLEECAAPYETIVVDRVDGHLPESYRAINPMMQIPALVLPDGAIMTETAAMLIYLADLFPATALAPPLSSAARARYLRWMVFLATNIYMTDLAYFYAERYSTEASHAPGIKAKAAANMNRQFAILSEAVGRGPYVLGPVFSAVDIYASMMIKWSPEFDDLTARHPNLKVLHDRVVTRPTIAPVWKRNEM